MRLCGIAPFGIDYLGVAFFVECALFPWVYVFVYGAPRSDPPCVLSRPSAFPVDW